MLRIFATQYKDMESLDRLYPLLHLDICSVTYVRCIFYFSFAISEIITTFVSSKFNEGK